MALLLSEKCSSCSNEEEMYQEIENSVYDNIQELVEKTLGPNGLTIDGELFWENEDMDTSIKLAISTITNCLTNYKHKGIPTTSDDNNYSLNKSEKLKPNEIKHKKGLQTEFIISSMDFENIKYLNDSKTKFINNCGITIISCSNYPCTNHIYVDDEYLFSSCSLSLLIPSSHLEERFSYESWSIPNDVSLESILTNKELICPDCRILTFLSKNTKDNN